MKENKVKIRTLHFKATFQNCKLLCPMLKSIHFTNHAINQSPLSPKLAINMLQTGVKEGECEVERQREGKKERKKERERERLLHPAFYKAVSFIITGLFSDTEPLNLGIMLQYSTQLQLKMDLEPAPERKQTPSLDTQIVYDSLKSKIAYPSAGS